ncbi:response regulator transcription factor [Paenibacillus thalictri]|uniref:Response regulator transcription factor n=1 Tax=Paenibacillus thalictri TaxID=2527873 RepID=A0A4Q9DXD6_9BACL|nr:response regulator transcription factor [Paenibacillus thalictri]TBL80437.1 response regulator transcription factor [Paenibacillus thalictri]
MTEPIRVVIAEDLDVLREHFAELVRNEEGLSLVGIAASGSEAFELAETYKPHVMLMDIEMDVKHDGIFAAKRIMEQWPDIRIVFLTVHEDDETVFNAFEAGAVDYVLKTAKPREIMNSIRAARAGNSPIRPEIAYKIRNEFTRIKRSEAKMFEAMTILAQLTPTEMEVIELLLQDQKLTDIAKTRKVEMSTIKSQINGILKKFNKNRTKEVIHLLQELNVTHLFRKNPLRHK